VAIGDDLAGSTAQVFIMASARVWVVGKSWPHLRQTLTNSLTTWVQMIGLPAMVRRAASRLALSMSSG
jgi:hypothetical protein